MEYSLLVEYICKRACICPSDRPGVGLDWGGERLHYCRLRGGGRQSWDWRRRVRCGAVEPGRSSSSVLTVPAIMWATDNTEALLISPGLQELALLQSSAAPLWSAKPNYPAVVSDLLFFSLWKPNVICDPS